MTLCWCGTLSLWFAPQVRFRLRLASRASWRREPFLRISAALIAQKTSYTLAIPRSTAWLFSTVRDTTRLLPVILPDYP